MKIAVTGHTRGLGKAISEKFKSHGHEVLGFSKSQGVDIQTDRKSILESVDDCDIFINNAYDMYFHYAQTELLKEIVEKWAGKDKLIINICSKCTIIKQSERVTHPLLKEFLVNYESSKSQQEEIVRKLMQLPLPRIMNVTPGIIDTDMSSIITAKQKMSATDIADLIYHCVSIQPKMIVQQLTLDVYRYDWSETKFEV